MKRDIILTEREFDWLIAMRAAQRVYFKDRTQSALICARELERKIDTLITKVVTQQVESQLELPEELGPT